MLISMLSGNQGVSFWKFCKRWADPLLSSVQEKLMVSNGTTRIGLTIAGVIAAISVVFSAGIVYAKLTFHVEDEAIHTQTEGKYRMIDSRVEMRFGPRLDAIDKHLKQIDNKLDWLRNDQNENHAP